MASSQQDDITENSRTEDSDDDMFSYYQHKTLATLHNPNPEINPLCDGWCRLNDADAEHIRTLVDRQPEIGDSNNVLNIHLGLLRHYLNIYFPIDCYCRCNDPSGVPHPPVDLDEWNIPTIDSEGKIKVQPQVLGYLEDALSKFYDWERFPAKPFDADAIMGKHNNDDVVVIDDDDDDVINIDDDGDTNMDNDGDTNMDNDGDINMDNGVAAEPPEVISLVDEDVEVEHANTKSTKTKKKVRFALTVKSPVLDDAARRKARSKRFAALRALRKHRRARMSGPTSNPVMMDVNFDDWLVDWSNPSAEIWE